MAGFVTSVIIRVGSVTSTCLRSSAGDIRNLSGPMVTVSSGTLPGQISTISGSAALTDHATNNEATNAAADLKGCMMEFLRHEVFDWLSGMELILATGQARTAARHVGQQ